MEEERGGAGLSASDRFLHLLNRFYDGVRSSQAEEAARAEPVQAKGFDDLRDHKYCLLITFRRDGGPVPTPLWFGFADGNLYFRTGRDVPKTRRIEHDPHVRVAPCTARGRPLGPAIEGTARVLPEAEEGRAEAALEANYGFGRRVYENTAGAIGSFAYLEVVPVAA